MKEAIIPPKRRFIQDPHDVTSQETAILIVTAVITSNRFDHGEYFTEAPSDNEFPE
jgi:glutamate-1-semialdehyde aminotransferase